MASTGAQWFKIFVVCALHPWKCHIYEAVQMIRIIYLRRGFWVRLVCIRNSDILWMLPMRPLMKWGGRGRKLLCCWLNINKQQSRKFCSTQKLVKYTSVLKSSLVSQQLWVILKNLLRKKKSISLYAITLSYPRIG